MIKTSRLWLMLLLVAILSVAVATFSPSVGVVQAAATNTQIVGVTNPATFTEASNSNVFSIEVKNATATQADGPAGGFHVTATLPSGFTVNLVGSGSLASNWDCSASSGQTLNCFYTTSINLPGGYDNTFPVSVTVISPALVTGNFAVSLTQAINGDETNTFDNTYVQNYTVIPKPNLIISRFFHAGNGTTSGSNFATNTQGTFTATIRNIGNAPTTGPVQLDFQLPTAANFVLNTPTTSTGFACTDQGGGLIRCTRSTPIDIGAGNQVDVIIGVTPTLAMASQNATATVTGGGEPPAYQDPNNGPITDSVTVVGSPNLSVVKSHIDPFTAGTNGVYNFAVTNNAAAGPTIAPIILTDALPAGMTYVSFTTSAGGGFNCSASSGSNISCTRSTVMIAGEVETVSVTVAVPATVPAVTPVTNHVTVTSTGSPSNSFNTNVPDVTNISYVDVQLVSKVPYYAGANTTFVVDSTDSLDQGFIFTVKNNGTGATVNPITLTDALSGGMTSLTAAAVVDSGTPTWACTGTTSVTCTSTGALSASGGGSDTSVFRVKVHVPPSAYSSVTNSATVAHTPDSNAANNTASSGAVQVNGADVTIGSITTTPGTFTANVSTNQYSIVVNNVGNAQTFANGPAPAPQFTLAIQLPANFTYVSQVANADWACPAGPLTGTVTCVYNGATLGAVTGTTSALVINVQPQNAVPAPGATLTVTVTQSDDVVASNNTATNTVIVNGAPAPDMEVIKTSGTITQNDPASFFTLTVRNRGTLGTAGATIVLQDTMPAGANITIQGTPSTTLPGGSCAVSGAAPSQTVTCTATGVNIPVYDGTSGTQYTVTILVKATSTGSFSNTAQFTTLPLGDANSTNDQSILPFTIVAAPVPDLTISKSHSGSFYPNASPNTAQFIITVTNVGGAPTTGSDTVTVVDTLQSGWVVTAFGPDANGWTCAVSFPSVTCTHAAQVVNVGASYPVLNIPVVVMSPPITPPVTLTNTATISASSGGEPNTVGAQANNTATDQVTITAAAAPDMTIDKSHTGTFTYGLNGTYTIKVTNVGSGATSGGTITVTDTLPTGFTYVSGSGLGWTCPASVAGSTVSCTSSGVVASGTSLGNLSITVKPLTSGTLINHVVVSGVANDANPNNNSDDDSTIVGGAPDLGIDKTHSPSLFQSGANDTYTLTITNVGTATTPSGAAITVVDNLPTADLTYNGYTSSTFACTTAPSGSSTVVTCTRLSTMAPTNADTITIKVIPTATGSFPKAFTNVATVSIVPSPAGPSPDTNSANDTDSDPTSISNVSTFDLALLKSHSGSFQIGQPGTYTLTVRNDGNAAYTGAITVQDNLPTPNITFSSFSSVSGGTWTCNNVSNVVTCNLPSTTLNVGASASVTITVATTGPEGTYTNTASLQNVPAGDPNPANNSANNGAGDPTNLVIVPPISTSNSTISAAPQSGLLANNLDTTTVTVTVKDTNGAVMPGKTVTLNPSTTLGGGLQVASTTATTNSLGVATFSVRSSQPGTVSFSATVDGQTIQNTAATTVTFSSTTALNPGHSTLSASPTTVAADGTSFSTVTAHILTNTDTPVVGASVILTYTTNTGNTTGITPASGSTATTNSNGDATFQLKSSTNQIVTLSATASVAGQPSIELTQHPVVTFGTGGTTTTGNTYTVTTDCVSVAADNIQVANISVTAKDTAGAAITGKTFTLAGAPVLSGMTIQPASAVTDATGIAKFSVRSTSQGGPVTFTATNTTDTAVLTQTVQITFTKPGTKCVASTTATAAPTSPSDGVVITALLCIRTGPGFGYARYNTALKFRTVVRVLGRTTRVPGLGVRDNCIHRGGPTWYFVQLADGRTVWANANYIRLASRLAFNTLPVLPTPPLPGQPGAGQAAVIGIVGGPVATPKP